MKFLVPNYRYLQNPRLRGYRPQIPVLSVLCPQLSLLTPLPPNKIPGNATVLHTTKYKSRWMRDVCRVDSFTPIMPYSPKGQRTQDAHERHLRFVMLGPERAAWPKFLKVWQSKDCLLRCSSVRSGSTLRLSLYLSERITDTCWTGWRWADFITLLFLWIVTRVY